MLITQTEDAINELGEFMYNATFDATESLRIAKIAEETAATAQKNAVDAFNYAGSALGIANTLNATVDSFDRRINKTEENSSSASTAAASALQNSESAITTANNALLLSQQAVTTANEAKATSDNAEYIAHQAEVTSSDAKEVADSAKAIAQQAVIDGERIKGEVQTLVSEAETHSQNAALSETNAKTSEDTSADNAELAKKWATQTPDPVETASGEEGSEDLYSARQYSLNAAASEAAAFASAMSSSESETAAKQSERNAADSAVASASSATAAANSEAGSATYATKAADWAIKMDAPVEEGTTDEETGETTEDLYSSRWYANEAKTARDEAIAAAGQNKNAVTFVPQVLTDEQKAQAVANIGALSQEVMAQAILDAFTQFNEENGFE